MSETLPPYSASAADSQKPITLTRLLAMHAADEKIAMLTCYDASFAALCARAGVDVLLVGDSLGMVIQGESSTLPVTIDEMRYHVACVARGIANANAPSFVIGDLPFATYHASPAVAFDNAAILMSAGAQMVKLEGAGLDNRWLVETIRFLVARGIPVCAHLGLTPQSVHQLGGYRVQGRGGAADRLTADALAVAEAGASMLVLEMVPGPLAAAVTEAVAIPTIGIGAGGRCSGQVLVLHDMLGVYPGRRPRFVKNFAVDDEGVTRDCEGAVRAYVDAVRRGTFPSADHTFDR